MQTLRLDATRLPDFIGSLMEWGPVWAPVEGAPDAYRLQVLEDVAQARPDALRTLIPFKKLLLAPKFTMMKGGFAETGGLFSTSTNSTTTGG